MTGGQNPPDVLQALKNVAEAPRDTSRNQKSVPTMSHEAFADEISKLSNHASELVELPADSDNMFENFLELSTKMLKAVYYRALEKQAEELKKVHEGVLLAEREAAAAKTAALQKQVEELKERVSKDDSEYIEGDKAIKDMEAIMDAEIRASRRSHLEQLEKVRIEAFQEGLKFRPDESLAQMERLKKEHVEKLRISRQEAEREGRQAALREVGLGGGRTVAELVNNHNELNTSRKVSSS
jgi:hypothetical protein